MTFVYEFFCSFTTALGRYYSKFHIAYEIKQYLLHSDEYFIDSYVYFTITYTDLIKAVVLKARMLVAASIDDTIHESYNSSDVEGLGASSSREVREFFFNIRIC